MNRSILSRHLQLISASFCVLGAVTASAHEREAQALSAHPQAAGGLSGIAHIGWESRHFLEGRDALDGDALGYSSVELSWESLSWGLWYGNSSDQGYDELQASCAFSQSIGELDYYFGYTHFRFPHDGGHDHEFGAGLVWDGGPLGLELALDAYHSLEADGAFIETAATRSWQLCEKVSADLSGIFGVNQGYISDGHDGANHVACRIGLSYAISDTLALHTHGTYSWGIDRDPLLEGDDALKDFFHAGLGLEWTF